MTPAAQAAAPGRRIDTSNRPGLHGSRSRGPDFSFDPIVPVITEYMHSHLVPHLPKAMLAATIMVPAALCALCGLILDTVSHARVE